MEFDPVSNRVIGLMLEVHRELGPGLLESAYPSCLAYELKAANIPFESEVPLPVRYKGLALDCAYRMDFVIEKSLVLELKSVDALLPIHDAQLLTYLRLSGLKIGLLVNFNVPLLRQGLKRLVL
ncbi:MAG: GxxExxY protein [bacterium]|nr:GxxExxY protein [bacterium]MDI1334690.1 GxxExxY protein [Lacunisphaera sp.]